MRKHKYLVSYVAQRSYGGNLIYGEITITTNKKIKTTDMTETKVVIAKTSQIEIDIASIIITSIFYFGKEVVK